MVLEEISRRKASLSLHVKHPVLPSAEGRGAHPKRTPAPAIPRLPPLTPIYLETPIPFLYRFDIGEDHETETLEPDE